MVLLSRVGVAVRMAVVVGLIGAGMGDGRWAMGDSNPRQLRALQVLDKRNPGVAPRVRFEWDPVPAARRYVLTGHWTTPPSWAVQSQQLRVTPQNATAWESGRVAFEVTLSQGFHSWSVVALFGPDEHGDFDHPTTVSFDAR